MRTAKENSSEILKLLLISRLERFREESQVMAAHWSIAQIDNHQWLSHSVSHSLTRVGIELLGQPKIGEEYNPPPHSNGGFVSDIVTHAPKLVLCCCLKTSHHIWLGSNFVQTWIDLEYLEYRLHATNQINNHTGVLDKVFSLYYMHHIYGQFRGRIGTNSNFFRRSEMSSSSKT